MKRNIDFLIGFPVKESIEVSKEKIGQIILI